MMQMVPGDATGEEIFEFPVVQIPVETGVWHRGTEAVRVILDRSRGRGFSTARVRVSKAHWSGLEAYMTICIYTEHVSNILMIIASDIKDLILKTDGWMIFILRN